MSLAAEGGTITLFAQYQDGTGSAVTPATPTVSIVDPLSVVVIGPLTPTAEGPTGRYSYIFSVPALGPLGSWTAVWTGIINSAAVEATEVFQVVEAGDIVFPPEEEFQMTEIRYRTDELKTDLDGDGSETFFTDDTLIDLLNMAGGNLTIATYEAWRWKAARYARLVNITESGSNREMSQKFDHAMAMVKHWGQGVKDDQDALVAAMAGRVVGRVINLRGTGVDDCESPYPFAPYTDYVRIFPSHRLLVHPILG